MRILLGLAALLCVCAAQAQSRIIYLNLPGGLEALERANPSHYDQARAILTRAEQQPQHGVFLMSYPPKQNVHFRIDDVEYRATVTLTNWRVKRAAQ